MKKDTLTHTTTEENKKVAVHYMKTLVEVAREAFLILDSRLIVISASPTFYNTFRVTSEETENVLLYKLGNGQWNIPELKKLLEEILPKKKTVRDYSVQHVFEAIGAKTILLNASQIDSVQLIILAMEDITIRSELEKKLKSYSKELELKVAKRTAELELRVKDLERVNKVMIGREMRMIELKKQLAKFKKERKP